MTGVFADYARYYDALYSGKDYEAEALYFHLLIQKYGELETRKILEFGAGTGKHQLAFTQLGYSAEAVEPSQEMCKIGTIAGARIRPGDFQSYRHPEKVDAVLALFHVVSYLTADEDLLRAFENARSHLVRGGFVCF